MKSEVEARSAAMELETLLRGDGWTMEVWVDGRQCWHAAASHWSTIRVHASRYDSGSIMYWAEFGREDGGLPEWSKSVKHFPDPNEAVVWAVEQARKYVDELCRIVAVAGDVLAAMEPAHAQ